MKQSKVSSGDILSSTDTHNWISHSVANRNTEVDTFKEPIRDASIMALAFLTRKMGIRIADGEEAVPWVKQK